MERWGRRKGGSGEACTGARQQVASAPASLPMLKAAPGSSPAIAECTWTALQATHGVSVRVAASLLLASPSTRSSPHTPAPSGGLGVPWELVTCPLCSRLICAPEPHGVRDAGVSPHLGPSYKFLAPFLLLPRALACPPVHSWYPHLPSISQSPSGRWVVSSTLLRIIPERWPQLLTCSHRTKWHKVFCRKAAIAPALFLPLSPLSRFFQTVCCSVCKSIILRIAFVNIFVNILVLSLIIFNIFMTWL